jgi:clan AA aspartic protease (TIGR02281 family)
MVPPGRASRAGRPLQLVVSRASSGAGPSGVSLPLQPAPQTDKQIGKRIPLRLVGNNYTVPVLINGRIWLDFMIDTGASDVTIPADVAMTLTRAGTIAKEDIGNEQTYGLANGEKVKNTQFRIHSIQIGEGDNDVIAQNVVGSIGGSKESLLLGQSFLRRFRSTTIDHADSVLIVDPEPQAVPAFVPASAPAPAPGTRTVTTPGAYRTATYTSILLQQPPRR